MAIEGFWVSHTEESTWGACKRSSVSNDLFWRKRKKMGTTDKAEVKQMGKLRN